MQTPESRAQPKEKVGRPGQPILLEIRRRPWASRAQPIDSLIVHAAKSKGWSPVLLDRRANARVVICAEGLAAVLRTRLDNNGHDYRVYEGKGHQMGLANLNKALGQMYGSQTALTDPCDQQNLRGPNQ